MLSEPDRTHASAPTAQPDTGLACTLGHSDAYLRTGLQIPTHGGLSVPNA